MGLLKPITKLWGSNEKIVSGMDTDITKVGEKLAKYDPKVKILWDHTCNLLFIGRLMPDGDYAVLWYLTDAQGGYRLPNLKDYEDVKAGDLWRNGFDAAKFKRTGEEAKARREKEWNDFNSAIAKEVVARAAHAQGVRPSVSFYTPGRND